MDPLKYCLVLPFSHTSRLCLPLWYIPAALMVYIPAAADEGPCESWSSVLTHGCRHHSALCRVWRTPPRPRRTLAGLQEHATAGNQQDNRRDSPAHMLLSSWKFCGSPWEHGKEDVLNSRIVLAVSMTKAQNTKHKRITYWRKKIKFFCEAEETRGCPLCY